MSISNYAELEILDHLTGTASWTAPSSVYLKLHTGDPGEDCTSNAATEDTR
ncbi:MAG: phage tail fiber protein, partial [Ilumatobacteraceae bacterium]